MLYARIGSAVVLSVAAGALRAQDTTVTCNCTVMQVHTPTEFEKRSSGSITFIQARPQDQLAHNIGLGYGGQATYLFRLDSRGFAHLRGDLALLGYGIERKHVPLSPTIGGRIRVDVSTTNYILPLSIGPELMWPTGPVRPYVNAGLGTQVFWTESSVSGSDDVDGTLASTTNQSDWTSTWVAGGGVFLPVKAGKAIVSIDLGVQYVAGGRAQYLRPGSIRDVSDTQIAITPLESMTHMALIHLGVRIGL